jgi:4'-phosphopantetheinyl transferase
MQVVRVLSFLRGFAESALQPSTFACMPLHSIQLLGSGARLGLWHLDETAAQLWPLLPNPAAYQLLLPVTADATRQAQWLGGRVLMHELLAATVQTASSSPTAIHLANDATGRPHLPGWPEAAVSLSHSGEWVAALLAPTGQAGIDVELVRDKAQQLARRFLSEEELATLQGAPPSCYSLLWSAKETLYKLAARRGLIFREHLLTAPFNWQTSGDLMTTVHRDGSQTRHRVCYMQPAPGYVLTYCHEPLGFSPIAPSA